MITDRQEIKDFLSSVENTYKKGDIVETEQICRKAIQICEKNTVGKEHRDYIGLLEYLSCCLHDQYRYAEEEAVYKDIFDLLKKYHKFKKDDILFSDHFYNLINCIRYQGRYEEAENLYKQALNIRLNRGQKKHTKWEDIDESDFFIYKRPLLGLANCFRDEGRYEEAETLYKKLRHFHYEQMHPDHDEDHMCCCPSRYRITENQQDYSVVLFHFADYLYGRSRYDEAESVYRECLDIHEELFGKGHTRYALVAKKLSECLSRSGKTPEGQPA